MKHLKAFSVLVIIAVFFSACKTTPHDKISGKWNISKIENSTMTDQEDIDFFNQMNADLMKSQEVNFAEGKITKTYPDLKEGTWEMDEEGSNLKIDWGEEDTYSPHNYIIKSLTDDSMIVEEDYEEFLIITTYIKSK